jgi:hypothetical protein
MGWAKWGKPGSGNRGNPGGENAGGNAGDSLIVAEIVKSVKRTTAVWRSNTAVVRSTDSFFPTPIPSHEWLGYFHGVRFADAFARFHWAEIELTAHDRGCIVRRV